MIVPVKPGTNNANLSGKFGCDKFNHDQDNYKHVDQARVGYGSFRKQMRCRGGFGANNPTLAIFISEAAVESKERKATCLKALNLHSRFKRLNKVTSKVKICTFSQRNL